MEGLTPFDQVREIVRRDKTLYPGDNESVKDWFLKFAASHEMLTLLTDSQGRLEGFLLCFRRQGYGPVFRDRPEPVGDTVIVDYLYIAPNAPTGTLRRLLKLALEQNKERFAGAEYLKFSVRKHDKDKTFSYPVFAKRIYRNGKQK